MLTKMKRLLSADYKRPFSSRSYVKGVLYRLRSSLAIDKFKVWLYLLFSVLYFTCEFGKTKERKKDVSHRLMQGGIHFYYSDWWLKTLTNDWRDCSDCCVTAVELRKLQKWTLENCLANKFSSTILVSSLSIRAQFFIWLVTDTFF